jgi:hypothetical protein
LAIAAVGVSVGVASLDSLAHDDGVDGKDPRAGDVNPRRKRVHDRCGLWVWGWEMGESGVVVVRENE